MESRNGRGTLIRAQHGSYIHGIKIINMKKLKALIVLTVAVGLGIGYCYVDYTIYKAKYPNTTMWMYIIDGNK